MFARLHRLSRSVDVRLVVSSGLRWQTPYLRIYWLARAADQPTRSTVVVSKKTAKKAVARNRLKRRTRAAVKSLHLKPGYDCVFFPRPELLERPFNTVVADLERWRERLSS